MSDEPVRHRIEVACPSCGHLQKESALVVSTQCRACGENFKVEDGKAVLRIKPSTRLVKTRAEDSPLAAHESAIRSTTTAFRSPSAAAAPKQGLLERLFNRVKPPRDITCLSCHHAYKVAGDAQSTQCPRCSTYISLLDYEITQSWQKRIQTRGNVIIQKGGSISGVPIQCHHLIVWGEFNGSVDCSGSLIIRNHGRILGKVRCKELRVEKGARVEFLNPVFAETAYIDGIVTGQIICTGSVTLEKRTHLTGSVKTSSLIVKPGAKHSGSIEMVSKSSAV